MGLVWEEIEYAGVHVTSDENGNNWAISRTTSSKNGDFNYEVSLDTKSNDYSIYDFPRCKNLEVAKKWVENNYAKYNSTANS